MANVSDSGILIIGSRGQLGTALRQKYPNAQAVDSDILDITDRVALEDFDWRGIRTIINAAAYTDVDGAETPDGKELAFKVNSKGVKNLSELSKSKDITLVHISTEYVFDGERKIHDEEELPNPLSEYGKSKAEGEKPVTSLNKYYLVRTSWLIGEGKNFVRTMLELGKKGVEPKVVNDQIGRLTFTSTLVSGIDYLLTTSQPFGIYNVTNAGPAVSWADITHEIFETAGFNLKVTGISTEEYFKDKPDSAKRPLKSTLDLTKIQSTGFKPIDWRVDLENYIKKEI